MTCRAPNSQTTCSGSSPTGAQFTWDTEGRLAAWQNTLSTPTTTASYLYDGAGQRVVQKVTTSGTTTATTYLGGLEEVTMVTSSQAPTSITTTDYFRAAGRLVAETVNGATDGLSGLSYLVINHQRTPLEALDRTGVVTASRLYAPYGASRYSSGSFPTSVGYIGHRSDVSTGLDYYGAQTGGWASLPGYYYDPALAQVTAPSSLTYPTNPYGYSQGNPELGAAADECPGWLSTICDILIAIATGIGMMHADGAPQAQNLDDPSGVVTTITTGNDKTGTRVQFSAREDSIRLFRNGKPIQNDDDNTNPGIPSEPTPRGDTPLSGQVGKSQTQSVNPAVTREESGSAGYRRSHLQQATLEHQRMSVSDAQQDAMARPGVPVIPALVEVEPPSVPWWEQVGSWIKSKWPEPSQPAPAGCEFASAGCIDPTDPFKNGDPEDAPDIPLGEPLTGHSRIS